MKGLLSAAVVVVVVLVSTLIVFSAVNPVIEEGQKVQSLNDAKQILKTIDAVVNQLSFESTGAKRSIDISMPDGRFIFSGRDDSLRIRLEDISLLKPGTSVEEENIVLHGGGVLDAYETDVLNDGQIDFVLENSAIVFAVKKLGSPKVPVFINTSSIIVLVQNKLQHINITPRAGIFINDKANSSFGQGYTELPSSNNIQVGSVILHMNSTANITYDAVFSLSASNDFIELEVKNIKGK